MARNSKKRNADTSLEDLDDLLRSPSNRSRRSEGDCGDEEISNDESRVEYHDKEEDREPVAEDSIRDASQYKQEEQGSDDDVLAADNQGDAENSHDGQEDGDPNDENMHPEEDDGPNAEQEGRGRHRELLHVVAAVMVMHFEYLHRKYTASNAYVQKMMNATILCGMATGHVDAVVKLNFWSTTLKSDFC